LYLLQTEPLPLDSAAAVGLVFQKKGWGCSNSYRASHTRNRLLTYDLATRSWLPEHEFTAPVYKLVGVDSRGRLWAEDLMDSAEDASLTLYAFEVP
jgi:hypothetical protein